MPDVLRLSAFTDDPRGGNPAGVVLDAGDLDAAAMQRIAREVGCSETAFLAPAQTPGTFVVRYFSQAAEVPFCGHATIASGVAVGDGELTFRTASGDVAVHVADGRATLTSVPPHVDDVAPADVDTALTLLRWSREDLDPSLPPRVGYAGARHLILAAATRGRLARLDYDFAGLRAFMLERDLTTVDLVWREDERTFHARNPFPVGDVVEDPATGGAAAALGAYLREVGAVRPPAAVTVLQGEDMGRPSRIEVAIAADRPEIAVTGAAVRM